MLLLLYINIPNIDKSSVTCKIEVYGYTDKTDLKQNAPNQSIQGHTN